MERTKYIIILTLIFLVPSVADGSYRSDIYNSYINGNMGQWKKVIDRMANEKYKSTGFLLELINYQYGYIAWCVGNNNNDEAKEYLDKAENNLDLLPGSGSYQSFFNSYKAAFYGYRIGMNKILAPFLGLKSIDCAKQAIKLDPGNPLGYIQYANIQFYMPSVFGGSKKEALEYYLKARELMEKDIVKIEDDWNYLNLLAVIAQTYTYLDNYQASKKLLEEILVLEPGFKWVRDELYPDILARMEN